MSDKCKWVDGKFKQCDGMLQGIREEFYIIKPVCINYCPWCGLSLKKPIKIEVGMFGYFWDNDSIDNEYGILTGVSDSKETRYTYHRGDSCYNYFKPGLPEGFNQDGTPIRPNAWRDGSERL